MRKWVMVGGMVVALFGLSAAAGLSESAAPDEAIKAVMKAAMKGGLCKKVASGEGTEADKKELLRMFESLTKATPPQGEAASWKEKTNALVSAAKDVLDGKPGATETLKKAATCKACHDVHKGQ